MLKKIISGGQTGVDIAALRAAKTCGIETGGFMPFGFLTTEGIKPEYASLYGMKQTGSKSYTDRTEKNVDSADLVILIGTCLTSPGSRATKRYANGNTDLVEVQWSSDYIHQENSKEYILRWLTYDLYHTVMVAGNRDAALEAPVEAWLTDVFRRILKTQTTEDTTNAG